MQNLVSRNCSHLVAVLKLENVYSEYLTLAIIIKVVNYNINMARDLFYMYHVRRNM